MVRALGYKALVLRLADDAQGDLVVTAWHVEGDSHNRIRLTPTEHDVLKFMLLRRDRPVRADEILRTRATKQVATLRTNISRLEAKLKKDARLDRNLFKSGKKRGTGVLVSFNVELEEVSDPISTRETRVGTAGIGPTAPAVPLAELTGYLDALVSLQKQPLPWFREAHRELSLSEVYVQPQVFHLDGRGTTRADLARELRSGTSFQLTAEPGIGKTALLTMIALDLAQSARESLVISGDVESVPVVVHCRNWTTGGFLQGAVVLGTDTYPDARQWLETHPERIVLLLDALDELPNRELLAQLEYRGPPDRGRGPPSARTVRALLVTGRPASRYKFVHLIAGDILLRELNAPQRDELIDKVRVPKGGTRHGSAGPLGGNPFFLTLSTLFAKDGENRLPLPELLERATAYLLRPAPTRSRSSAIPAHLLIRTLEELSTGHLQMPLDAEPDEAAAGELQRRSLVDQAKTTGSITLHHSLVEYFGSGKVVRTFLEKRLTADDWPAVVTRLGANGIACLWFRLCRAPHNLWAFASWLYAHLRVQQFMYDVQGLGEMEAMLAPLESDVHHVSPEAQVVFLKMLGHAAYDRKSDPAQRARSIRVFERLLAVLGDNEDLLRRGHGELPFEWYRLFAQDHLEHLKRSPPATRLPPSFRCGAAPANDLERCLVLRAAHYFGHCGNRVFTARAANPQAAPHLDSGMQYLQRAIAYRLCSLVDSFPYAHDLQESVRTALGDALFPEELRWALSWKWTNTSSALEPFLTEGQALGDIANQVIGIGYLECWRFVDGDRDAAVRARKVHHAADCLWRMALDEYAAGGTVRYVLNLAGLAASLAVIERGPETHQSLDFQLESVRRNYRVPFLEDVSAQDVMLTTLKALRSALT